MSLDDICIIILKELRNHPEVNSHQLFDMVASTPQVLSARQKNEIVEQDILDSFEFLIDNGLIDGGYFIHKSGTQYAINGITQLGCDYLDEL